MTHKFDSELAEKVGIEAAIIYDNICFWIAKNKANAKGFINNHYWTYNSWEAWQKLFPYMKKYTIKTALQNLKDCGLIDWETGLNPNNKWDKTAYYRLLNDAIIDSGENQSSTIDKINDEYYTDIKPDGHPTEKQVLSRAKQLNIPEETAIKFYLHYEAMGWKRVLDFVPLLRKWDMEDKKRNNSTKHKQQKDTEWIA